MKNKLIVIDKDTAVALRGGQRYVLLPCRGIYNSIFEGVKQNPSTASGPPPFRQGRQGRRSDDITVRFVCGEWSMSTRCSVTVGYAPKEMGGYVGERYYILRLAQNSEK